MHRKTMVFGMLVLGLSTLGFTQEPIDSLEVEQLKEVVITDSKFELKRELSGKVITKITSQELQKLQGKSIAEVLNATAGIEINGTRSNAGQTLSYFVRGGRNRQVLVLIDGVPVTDASQIANDYDLRLLNADQVEQIEVLKGASSTLYGTGAATGVINIQLKKASYKKMALHVQSVLGTNQSQEDHKYAIADFRNSVSVNGTLGKLRYLASFGHQFSDGLSAIASGSESDRFNSQNTYLNLGYQLSDNINIKAYGSYDAFNTEFDDGFNLVDANNVAISDQLRLGLSSAFKYTHGNITANVIYNNIQRAIQSGFPAKFNANSFVGDIYNRYRFGKQFYTVLGANLQTNTMESFSIPFGGSSLEQDIDSKEAQFSIIDPYANVVYVSDFGLHINAGLRLNNHSAYGSHLIYSINPSYNKTTTFGYVKGLLSFSTAFIAPSLYQLFEGTYGNELLEPEENRTIEAGGEVYIEDFGTISLVYFNRLETNFIDFVDVGDFAFQYRNVDKEFTASGMELTADIELHKHLRFRTNGTYTKVDEDLGLRIPEFKVNASLDYEFNDRTNLSLRYQFNDSRDDSVYNQETFSNDIVSLQSFSLLDFYVGHSLKDKPLTVFMNVNNICNETYQELFGYTTKGRNINIGFTLRL